MFIFVEINSHLQNNMPLADDEQSEQQVQTLFKNIQKGIDVHGVKGLNRQLTKVAASKVEVDTYKKIDIVLKAVCNEYGVGLTKQLNKGFSKGKFKFAKYTCCCLLYFELDMSMRAIAKEVFKQSNPKFVFIAVHLHKNINTRIKEDKEYKERYDKILNEIKNKLN